MMSNNLFSTLLKAGVLTVFAVFAGMIFLSERAVPGIAAAGETVSSPRSLYVQNCSNCHGSDGRADTAKGRELDADDLTTSKVQNMSTSKLIRVITNGKGDMPSMRKKLTAAQIRSIAEYIRVF